MEPHIYIVRPGNTPNLLVVRLDERTEHRRAHHQRFLAAQIVADHVSIGLHLPDGAQQKPVFRFRHRAMQRMHLFGRIVVIQQQVLHAAKAPDPFIHEGPMVNQHISALRMRGTRQARGFIEQARRLRVRQIRQ